jgi:hypothetical protein
MMNKRRDIIFKNIEFQMIPKAVFDKWLYDPETIEKGNRHVDLNVDLVAYIRRIRRESNQADAVIRGVKQTAPSSPPLLASKICSIVAGPKHRDDMLGDLEEQYHATVKRFDEHFAMRQYWIDVALSVPHMLVVRFGKTLAFAFVTAWLRKRFGI